MPFLEHKIANLPVWAWGLIGIAGAGIGWYLMQSFKTPAADSTSSADATQGGVQYLPQGVGAFAGLGGSGGDGAPSQNPLISPLTQPPGPMSPPPAATPPPPAPGGGFQVLFGANIPRAVIQQAVNPLVPRFGQAGDPAIIPRSPLVMPAAPPGAATPVQQPTTAAPGSDGGNYPGLVPGFQMNCALTFTGNNAPSWEALWQQEVARTGYAGGAFVWRNCVTKSIQGSGSPWNIAPYVGHADPVGAIHRVTINQKRVAYGLYPLTDSDFDRMQIDIDQLSNGGNEKGVDFQNSTYGRTMFEHWSLPYQCGTHSPARSQPSQTPQSNTPQPLNNLWGFNG